MPFSLLDDAWIPAIDAAGARRWITPAEITARADSGLPLCRDVDWGRPDLRIATYELLIGLFATALAPTTADRLIALATEPPKPEALREALAPLAPYMILDGDGPRFQQDFEDIGGESNPPDALFMDAPGANTIRNGADLFVKRGRTPVLSRKAAAIALHALQAFAPSGGAGHRTSMRGGGPLTTLAVPHNPDLWCRIAANLPILTQPDRQAPVDLSRVFPWARPTRASRGNVVTQIGPEHGTHWLQHYFGMPRRIRLVFEANAHERRCALTGEVDNVVVTGFRMEAYGMSYGAWAHPLTPHYRDKAGQVLPVHPQGARIGYREWFGYQFDVGDKGPASLPACVVKTYADVLARQMGKARLLAAGYVTDNMKTEDYVEAEVPLVVVPSARARAQIAGLAQARLLAPAEFAAGQLRSALIASLGGDYKKTSIASAVDRFWTETEDAFRAAIETLAELYRPLGPNTDRNTILSIEPSPIVEAWLARFRDVALRIFRETAPLDQLGQLPIAQRKAIIDANTFLHLCLHGHGKNGQALFKQLELPLPAKVPAHGTNGISGQDCGASP